MQYRKKLSYVAGLILCSLLMACAPQILPRPGQSGLIEPESNIVTKEEGGIRISVQTEEWRFAPYSLNDYFTPFLFLIRNNTGEKVSVKYGGFTLFDEHGNQFGAVRPEDVEYMMAAKDAYGDRYPDIYYRFDAMRPPYAYGPEIPSYMRSSYSNISLLSLPETLVYTDSQVRGFLYFRKAISYGKALRLRVELGGFQEDFEFEIKK